MKHIVYLRLDAHVYVTEFNPSFSNVIHSFIHIRLLNAIDKTQLVNATVYRIESGASPLCAGLLRVDVHIEGATIGLLPSAFQC